MRYSMSQKSVSVDEEGEQEDEVSCRTCEGGCEGGPVMVLIRQLGPGGQDKEAGG